RSTLGAPRHRGCRLPRRCAEGQHGPSGRAPGRLPRESSRIVTVPKVDFYLLSDTEPRARLRTACRLAEKAYEQGLRVTVRTGGAAETAEIDELLWSFSDRSFVP